MCQVFISADPALYTCRARSVRLHGVATSIRLENLFWQVLEEIAARDGMSVPQLCARLHDELLAERGSVDNFASFLRVCCGRYLALQLSGGIPQDRSIPIRSLNPRPRAGHRACAVSQHPRPAPGALQAASRPGCAWHSAQLSTTLDRRRR